MRDHHTLSPRAERRILSLGALVGLLMGLILIVGALTAVGSLHNCQRVQHLYKVIDVIAQRSLKAYGESGPARPGTPGYAYYKNHPVELADVRKQIKDQIHEFRSPSCSLPF
jgi:hypothetical protein